MARTATATLAGRSLGCAQRVGDDRPQRPRATAAVRAAAEALIDLGRGARAARPRVETGAHIVVGEDVAGADDHVFPAEVSRRPSRRVDTQEIAYNLGRAPATGQFLYWTTSKEGALICNQHQFRRLTLRRPVDKERRMLLVGNERLREANYRLCRARRQGSRGRKHCGRAAPECRALSARRNKGAHAARKIASNPSGRKSDLEIEFAEIDPRAQELVDLPSIAGALEMRNSMVISRPRCTSN